MPATNFDANANPHNRDTVTDTKHTGWPLHFLVFSFNRGEFLAHCINSIRRCAPDCAITVYDDNSTDPLTRQLLSRLDKDKDVTVVQPIADGTGGKHGGLYYNMQQAWQALSDDTLICTLQDDMQMVRPLCPGEIGHWHHLFSSGAHRGFLQPAFIKSLKPAGTSQVRYDDNKQVYLIDREQRSAGAWYSDIFMIKVGLLRQADWQFRARESGNEQQARQHFQQMGYVRNPFVAWLPGAPAWRGKRRTAAMKYAERSRHCGFYPLQIMSEQQSSAFCARADDQLPLAESVLTLESERKLEKPWFYYPLQDRRLLKQLNRLELTLRRS